MSSQGAVLRDYSASFLLNFWQIYDQKQVSATIFQAVATYNKPRSLYSDTFHASTFCMKEK